MFQKNIVLPIYLMARGWEKWIIASHCSMFYRENLLGLFNVSSNILQLSLFFHLKHKNYSIQFKWYYFPNIKANKFVLKVTTILLNQYLGSFWQTEILFRVKFFFQFQKLFAGESCSTSSSLRWWGTFVAVTRFTSLS